MRIGRTKSEKNEPSVLELTQNLELYTVGIDHKSDLTVACFCEYLQFFSEIKLSQRLYNPRCPDMKLD